MAKKKTYSGVLAVPLKRRILAQYGDGPGRSILNPSIRTITNSEEMLADKRQQQMEKLPALCEFHGIDQSVPGWELLLATALAERHCDGFEFYRKGVKPKHDDQEQYDKAQAEFREIVRILETEKPPENNRLEDGDEEFTWAIRECAKRQQKSFDAVNGRFHKTGAENKRLLLSLGPTRLNLIANGALNAFGSVGAKLAEPMDEPLHALLGAVGGLAPSFSPQIVHIIYDPSFPDFARELQRALEPTCIAMLIPIWAQSADGPPILVEGRPISIPRQGFHFSAKQRAAMIDETEKYSARIILLDKDNMEAAAALSEAFAAAGVSATSHVTGKKLPGVGIFQAVDRFEGLPTPAIVTLGDRTPKHIREFSGKPAPHRRPGGGGLFASRRS